MRRHRNNLRRSSRHDREQGIVIAIVAVFMLVVIGAMMALSIDVVTFYTARSEAQLAADSAALAAARVLANSGATSDTTGTLLVSAEDPAGAAQSVALEVAEQNQVGGVKVAASQVNVSFPATPTNNPTVTVKVQIPNLPTYFARMLGIRFVTVAAQATAEAYNPSPNAGGTLTGGLPVAPICVKPWLLPNIDPSNTVSTTAQIFDPKLGAIQTTSLLGWNPNTSGAVPMSINSLACPSGNCTQASVTSPSAPPQSWHYYPGDDVTFQHPPVTALPSCTTTLTTNYQTSIAGCIQTPISCNSSKNIDLAVYPNFAPGPPNRNSDTDDAVNCLTHALNNKGDKVTTNATPPPAAPFQFVAGNDNPIAGTATNDVMVSDSLVTVPVIDVGPGSVVGWTNCPPGPNCAVQIIGFVQLFLNPDGNAAPNAIFGPGTVNTTVINLAGCGTNATGTAILGNGASPVAVRLISPP